MESPGRDYLSEWKWLAAGEFRLLAVSAFGDLFLQDVHGGVHWLDVTGGKLSTIANSEKKFREAGTTLSKKEEWFLEERAKEAERKGYSPGKGECVGSKIPWVFKESADMPDNVYVADIYEYASFMGDLHHRLHEVGDGGKVRLRVEPSTKQRNRLED
jgi:hypothetical protein